MPEYVCKLCGLKYAHRSGLQRHLRTFHNENSGFPKPAPPSFCCVVCSKYRESPISFDSKAAFSSHVAEEHNLQVQREKLSFSSYEDFCQWKRDFEEATRSAFVKPRSAKRNKRNQTILYECCRSGVFQRRGKGLRLLKTQGSKKIGGFCPAEIKLILENSGFCSVSYVPTHFGHDADLEHLALTREEKASIASEIAANVPFDEILEGIRCNVSDLSNFERLHLITKKDLHNIAESFELRAAVKHLSDSDRTNQKAMERSSLQEAKEEALSLIGEIASLIENSSGEEIAAAKKLLLAIPPAMAAVRASLTE